MYSGKEMQTTGGTDLLTSFTLSLTHRTFRTKLFWPFACMKDEHKARNGSKEDKKFQPFLILSIFIMKSQLHLGKTISRRHLPISYHESLKS